MLPLGTAWPSARKSRIFGGFLRFLTRYWKGPGFYPDTMDHGPPALDIGPLLTRFARRIAVAGSTITAIGSRFGMFGTWGAGHGAA